MTSTSICIEKNRNGMLNTYLQELIALTDPEKVFLVSATYTYQFTEDMVRKSPVSENSGKYGLFILYDPANGQRSEKAWFRHFGQLQESKHHQLEFMDVHEFNEKVKMGDKRLTQVLLNGMLWFDKGIIPLADPKWLAESV